LFQKIKGLCSMFRNSALKIGVQHMKNLRVKRFGQLGASMLAVGFLAFSAQATQTVDPFTAATGGTNMNGTTVPFTSNAVTFFGIYSTTTAAAESGLGVKVKYDSSKVSVAVSEEYEGCRIAAAQVQTPTVPGVGAQAVMGWIDTSIRISGAVGWPNVAEPAASGGLAPCLDPGNINGTPTGTTSGQKLFKVVATRVAGFTTGTTPISIDSDGNFSYAGASAGFAPKSFTIDAAASSGVALASASTSRPQGASTFPIAMTAINAGAGTAAVAGGAGISVESRAPNATAGQPQYTLDMVFAAVPSSSTPSVVSCVVSTGASTSAPCTTNPTFGTVATVGNTVSIPMNGITNQSRVRVSYAGGEVTVGFLVGDVTNNGAVSGTDATQVSLRVGQPVTAANARYDVTGNGGSISGTDATQTSLRVGTKLP
jgi:hypothetical protein